MNTASLVITIIIILDGLYSLITGRSLGRTKEPNHEPKAFAKWTRIAGLILVLVGLAWLAWEVPTIKEHTFGDKAGIIMLIVFVVGIAVMIITFFTIVKTADKKAGIGKSGNKGGRGNQNKFIDED